MKESPKRQPGRPVHREIPKSDSKVSGVIRRMRRKLSNCISPWLIISGGIVASGIVGGVAGGRIAVAMSHSDNPGGVQLRQNFDDREYAPFKAGERGERVENKGYVDSDIPLALGQIIDEDLNYPIPVAELFRFGFTEKGYIGIKPVYSGDKEIKDFLESKGFAPTRVYSAPLAHSTKRLAVYGGANKEFRIVYSDQVLNITASGKDGNPRTIEMQLVNEGDGVKVKEAFFGENEESLEKVKFISPEGEIGTFDTSGGYTYRRTREAKPMEIDSAESLQRFLSETKSSKMVSEFFDNQPEQKMASTGARMKDLRDVPHLIDIFRKMPKDPNALAGLLKFGIHYEVNDKSKKDEFRHPLETLKSGWGDCDDYVMVNQLWSHLNGYSPNLVFILDKGGTDGHVFIWYTDENGRTVVLDNDKCETLENGKKVEDYIKRTYPKADIHMNKKF